MIVAFLLFIPLFLVLYDNRGTEVYLSPDALLFQVGFGYVPSHGWCFLPD